jgi:iron complex transport system substrate-binding protein
MKHRHRISGVVVAGLLAVAACGSDDAAIDETSADVTDPTTEPATAPAADAPERVVSLSPTHTEIVFAIGADDLLVAVDDQSNHPAGALDLPNELSGLNPDVEAIVADEPDLVITGGDFSGLGDQLAGVGIDTWDGPPPATIDGVYAQIAELGAALGRSVEANTVVEDMRAEIEEITATVPDLAEPLAVYHELDPSLFSVDSSTFIGDVYAQLGLRNVADRIEGDFGGFPQLNQEFLVSADPDLIFLADTKCCGETAATVAERPGWEAIAAVRDGNVFELDDDVASRWGPRIVDFLGAVATAVGEATS